MIDVCSDFTDPKFFFEELEKQNPKAFECLYEKGQKVCLIKAFKRYKHLIAEGKLSEEEIYDVYHDSLVDFMEQIQAQKVIYKGTPIEYYLQRIFFNKLVSLIRQKIKRNDKSSDNESEESFFSENSSDENDTQLDEEDVFLTDDDPDFDPENTDCIYKILTGNELSESCKDLLWCYYVEDNKLKDCAERLGYSDAFVKQKRMRCIETMKKLYLMCKNN